MRWLCAVVMAVAAAAPALGSSASDAAYEAGRRHVEARGYEMALALLSKAAAADPESPSGHRARLLQILVLSAHVGRCLSALTSYDRALHTRPARAADALRRHPAAAAARGYGDLPE